MKTTVFHSTCQGESHLSSGRPCQDSSWSEPAAENGLCVILIVSDGHGSGEFFRSDRGSALAVQVAREAVISFVKNFQPEDCPAFVSRGIAEVKDCGSEDFTPSGDPNEAAFRQLASFILARWYEAVDDDWLNDPPSEEEDVGDGPAERSYGCTLQVAFRTQRYWAALQLGDGKIVAFWPDGSSMEPVPWDSECFQSGTTSLCTHRADRFRYCYGTDQPMALFLGSDGMDGSFMLDEDLVHFYESVLRRMEAEGVDGVCGELACYLPELSRKGSRDDMSVALWVDVDALPSYSRALRHRDDISKGLSSLMEKMSELIKMLKSHDVSRL